MILSRALSSFIIEADTLDYSEHHNVENGTTNERVIYTGYEGGKKEFSYKFTYQIAPTVLSFLYSPNYS